MLLDNLKESIKMVGLKQSARAVETGAAKLAYVAADAQDKVREPFLRLCEEHGVPVEVVDTMEQLGKACGIKVGAAVAAVLKD